MRVEVFLGNITNISSKNVFRSNPDVEGRPIGLIIAQDEVEFTADCDGGELDVTPVTPTIIGCNDGRLNQNACEPVAIYSVVSDDGVGVDVWEIDPETSVGTPSVYISAEELAAAQAAGTTSRCTIATSSDGRTGVYLLAGGEIEVIHGPDFESKFFVFTFESYPSVPTLATYIGTSLPSASEC